MTLLKQVFNAVAAKLPVIGPHAGIEADLLLAGLKPLGWVPVAERPPGDSETFLKQTDERLRRDLKIHDSCLALDKEVAAGRLAHRELPINGHETVHYYYRPQQEALMDELVAADKRCIVDRERGVQTSPELQAAMRSMHAFETGATTQPEALQKGKLDIARVFRRNNEPRPDPAVGRRNVLDWIKQCDDVQRLDEAVAAGRLKSADLVVPSPAPAMPPQIIRHYCQPGQEEKMALVIRQNEEWMGKRSNTQILDKDIGEYLGYRKKDIDLWYGLPGLRKLPLGLGGAIYNAARWASMSFAHDAYQEHMVDKAQKIIKRQEKPAAPKR